MTERTLRTFIALELPDEVKRTLARTQEQLRAELGPKDRNVRWTDPNGTHLTLKFLGATPETALTGIEEALKRATRDSSALRLRTGELGAFPGWRQPRVLWLGLDGDVAALGALQTRVEDEVAPLGWPTEERPFSPHLTLARLRAEARAPERAGVAQALGHLWPPPAVAFEVGELSLMLSELSPAGARYSRLFAVPLG